jgi:hypothetical protein
MKAAADASNQRVEGLLVAVHRSLHEPAFHPHPSVPDQVACDQGV